MIIRKYGIELHRLTHDDIELVRQARNRDDIRSRMFDQRIITKEEQEKWFASVNNMNNYYFTIVNGNEKVGLIYGKNFDWQKMESEGGMFIWNQPSAVDLLATKASILLMEFSFEMVKQKKTFIHVRNDNPKAISYNKALGYVATDKNDWYVLDEKTYVLRFPYLRKLVDPAGNIPRISPADIIFTAAERSSHLYKGIPENLLKSFGLANH